MNRIAVSPEVVSLVHHVELDKAGWWDKTIQRLIIAAIWLSDDSPTVDNVLSFLDHSFHIKLDEPKIQSQVNALVSQDVLLQIHDKAYKITDSALRKFENEVQQVEDNHTQVKARFAELLNSKCPDLDVDET